MSRYSHSIRPCSSPTRSSSHPRYAAVCGCDSTHDSHGRRSHGCNVMLSSCSDLFAPCQQAEHKSGCCLAKKQSDSTPPCQSRRTGSIHGQVICSSCPASAFPTMWSSAPPSTTNVCPNALYISGGCQPMIVSPCPQPPTPNIAIPCPKVVHPSYPDTVRSNICTAPTFSPGPSYSPVGLPEASPSPSKPLFVVVPSKKEKNADSRGSLKGSLKPMQVSAPQASEDEVTFAIMPPGYYPFLIPAKSTKSKRKSENKGRKSRKSKCSKKKCESEETSSEETSSEETSSGDSSSTESTSESSEK